MIIQVEHVALLLSAGAGLTWWACTFVTWVFGHGSTEDDYVQPEPLRPAVRIVRADPFDWKRDEIPQANQTKGRK